MGPGVAGRMLVNDLVTVFFLSGVLTPAHSIGCCSCLANVAANMYLRADVEVFDGSEERRQGRGTDLHSETKLPT
jgi:hypothetical protein